MSSLLVKLVLVEGCCPCSVVAEAFVGIQSNRGHRVRVTEDELVLADRAHSPPRALGHDNQRPGARRAAPSYSAPKNNHAPPIVRPPPRIMTPNEASSAR